MTRRGLLASALGAGVSLSNFAVALPLLVLARGDSPREAGALIGLETIAFSFGALLPLRFRRSAAPIANALGLVAVGDLVLAVPSGQLLLALGALIHGSGMGLFWVGVQASLGRRSGASGSERAFVAQYTLYVAGTASGGALTGAAIAALRSFGVDHVASIRLTFLIGAAAVVGALPVVLAWLRGLEPGTPIRLVAPRALYGLRLQLPDLLLVSAMGPLLGLAPVVLRNSFHLSPLPIGCVAGAVAAAKISGSVTASRVAFSFGRATAVGTMLAGAAIATTFLLGAHTAWLYVGLIITATFLGVGVWPTLVDGALARVTPSERHALSVIWNVREYAVSALATVGGALLLHVDGKPSLAVGFVAVLLFGAAVAALTGLRAPVYQPEAE
jgi:hypothetical protein